MTVDLEYQEALKGIVADVLKMEKVLEKDQQDTLEQIGKAIKKKVHDVLPKSDEMGTGYKHMRDDIKVTVNGKKRKTGVTGVTVHGGKLTAYKWHMLDDGTRNPDGTIHTPATHFTTKAVKDAENPINTIIDDLHRRIAEA